MEALLQFDQDLLLTLNSFTSPFFDNFFWVVTSKSVWFPLYAVILYVIFKNQGLKGIITIVALAVLVALCDQISTNVFKEGFERLRPSRDPALEGMVDLINGKRGGKYGFVSSHATNSFGLAVFSLLLFRYRWYSVFIIAWALLNSYSRIYMGVHYPGDTLGGLILGSLIGWFVYWLYKKVTSRFMPVPEDILPLSREREFSVSSVSQIIYTGILMVVVISLSSSLLVDLT